MHTYVTLACVAGARKGKGEGISKSGVRRDAGAGGFRARPIFPSPFPLLAPTTLRLHTVKPLLSGTAIKRTPSIKRTLSRVPKLTSYIPIITNPYSADTSIKRTRTLK